jgi:propionyl-CoA carboxylase alpha chain
MQDALDAFVVRGIAHNIPFLAAVLANQRFQDGRLTTGFIAEEFPEGFKGAQLTSHTRDVIAAVSVLVHRRQVERAAQIEGQLPNRAPGAPSALVVQLDGETRAAAVKAAGHGYDVTIDGNVYAVRSDWKPGQILLTGQVNAKPISVQVEAGRNGYRLTHAGAALDVKVLTPRAAELARHMPVKVPPDTSKFLLCPMPGLVVAIHVAEGEEVKAGQALAVVEAMKMENVLKAERDGVIGKISAKKGDSLAVDQVILEFA